MAGGGGVGGNYSALPTFLWGGLGCGGGGRRGAAQDYGCSRAGVPWRRCDVSDVRGWAGLLGLQRAVIEGVRMGNEGEVIVSARPVWRERSRCGVCRRRCPGYDRGPGRRRWRAL